MSEDQENAHYQFIRGFPCPVSERFTRKNIEDAMDLVPCDGDLILASYPKTGTTWVQYILLQIKSKGELFPSMYDATYKIVPYLELAGVAAVHAQDKPRFYKHHIAYNFVQKNANSKCIYTYRHPEDTVVSYYRFLQSRDPDFAREFNEFFDHFVTGNIAYSSYFKHVLSFYKHRDEDNLLMVSYEELHANRREEILKIAKFLGKEYYQNLMDDKLLDKIIEKTSFDYMKKNLFFPNPQIKPGISEGQTEERSKKVDFFRKGVVGDGKTLLNGTQRQRLKEAAENVLKGTSILAEWYPE